MRQSIARTADVLRVLGHDGRLRLMHCLMERGETSVGELETLTGIVQPGLSQQLGVLRNAGLVATRREAKSVHYRLVPAMLQGPSTLLMALATMQAPAPEAIAHSTPSVAPVATFARIE